jgi:hypothetical protein
MDDTRADRVILRPSPANFIGYVILAFLFFFCIVGGVNPIYGAVLLFLILAFPILSLILVRLVISPSGIEYHEIGFTLHADWADVSRIQKGRSRYGVWEDLIVDHPAVEAVFWLRPFLRIGYMDHRIPMLRFRPDWRQLPAGKYILSKIAQNNRERGENAVPWRN